MPQVDTTVLAAPCRWVLPRKWSDGWHGCAGHAPGEPHRTYNGEGGGFHDDQDQWRYCHECPVCKQETLYDQEPNPPAVNPYDTLAAAVDALGKIAHALNARRLLAEPIRSHGSEYAAGLRERLEAQALTDDQLDEIAVAAFEQGAMALAAAGHPGAVHHECSAGLDSPEFAAYEKAGRKE